MPYSVSIVEDNHAIRSQLEAAIALHPELSLLDSVSSLEEGRRAMRQRLPDVLLVDLGLPDGSGIELVRLARQAPKLVECMVVTIYDDETHVLAALEAGATGYLLKDASLEDMAESILELIRGGSPISPLIARALLRRLPLAENGQKNTDTRLTKKEVDVLNHLARGFTRSEIAKKMNVSVHTISTHIKHIYEKLAVHSSGEALFVARKTGILAFNED